MKYITCLLAGPLISAASPALAQSSPLVSRVVPLTFTGVVANDVTKTIRIRQPDGTVVPYTGPVPDYPYKPGDQVSISFNAVLPTKAFFEPGGPYGGQLAADGIYRFNIGQQEGASGFSPGAGGVGSISNPEISGPISSNANGAPTAVQLGIVYDANKDSYSLEFPDGKWAIGAVNAPSYTYDPATGTLQGGAADCLGGTAAGCSPTTPGGAGFFGNENLASAKLSIFAPGDANKSFLSGVMDLLFSGSWNLPIFGSGGGGSSSGGTEVPEPSMMLLFGGASALIMRRRRKRVA